MRFVNVKRFAASTTKYINGKDDVVITRYGKPISILSRVDASSPEELFLRMKDVVNNAGLKKKEVLKALDSIRKEIYV